MKKKKENLFSFDSQPSPSLPVKAPNFYSFVHFGRKKILSSPLPEMKNSKKNTQQSNFIADIKNN